jgi:hypothetical protein
MHVLLRDVANDPEKHMGNPVRKWTFSKRVFILGPSHHVYLSGCDLSACQQYSTPLGNLTIDQEGKNKKAKNDKKTMRNVVRESIQPFERANECVSFSSSFSLLSLSLCSQQGA